MGRQKMVGCRNVDYVEPNPAWLKQFAALLAAHTPQELSTFKATPSKFLGAHPEVKEWLGGPPKGLARVAHLFIKRVITGMGTSQRIQGRYKAAEKRSLAQWINKVQNVYRISM